MPSGRAGRERGRGSEGTSVKNERDDVTRRASARQGESERERERKKQMGGRVEGRASAKAQRGERARLLKTSGCIKCAYRLRRRVK